MQLSISACWQQRSIAYHHADPNVADQVGDLLDGAAIDDRSRGNGDLICSVRFSLQPDCERPWLRPDGLHGSQAPSNRRDQAPLYDDGEITTMTTIPYSRS